MKNNLKNNRLAGWILLMWLCFLPMAKAESGKINVQDIVSVSYTHLTLPTKA